jgi:hypothetical protein
MGRGIFSGMLKNLETAGEILVDSRREGFDLKYKLSDALKSALSVFFFQHPSMLDFQNKMKQKWKRSNLETMMGVKEIPSNVQITTLLDGISPDSISKVFNEHLQSVDEWGLLKEFRCLDGGVLMPVDGVWYFSSQQIHCDHCLHTTKEDITTYYHSTLAATLVRPGNTAVLPVAPEMITNQDGAGSDESHKKQDCERNAAKRWLSKHANEYKWLSPTLLGDDLFSNYPFCKEVLDNGYSFIFTCKEDSHPWLTETVKNSFLEETSKQEWNGKTHLTYTYRWLNNVQIRDNKQTLLVNYFSLSIWNEKKKKQTFYNTWITNKTITRNNVAHLASCGRSRWKIENEHNNVLKNHGYNLEHNFGHGDNHASEMYCLLNLLAFQMHSLLDVCDEDYQKARAYAGRRTEFFNELRVLMRRNLFESWDQFIVFFHSDLDTG